MADDPQVLQAYIALVHAMFKARRHDQPEDAILSRMDDLTPQMTSDDMDLAEAAMQRIGIDPRMLSSTAGHA